MKLQKKYQIEDEIDAALRKKEADPNNFPYIVTSRHITLVFIAIKNHASFNSHESGVIGMERHGSNILVVRMGIKNWLIMHRILN